MKEKVRAIAYIKPESIIVSRYNAKENIMTISSQTRAAYAVLTGFFLPLLAAPASAALNYTTVFEVRASATSPQNGGGFDPTLGGVDYTQQPNPQAVLDGAAITATTGGPSATLTLSGYTVANGDIGNCINITGGANVTPGVYQITGVSTAANTWTLDRAAAIGAASGVTGRFGGAIPHPALFSAIVATPGAGSPGMTCYIKNEGANGSPTVYSMGTVFNVNGGIIAFPAVGQLYFTQAGVGAQGTSLIGYRTTRTTAAQDAEKPILRQLNDTYSLFVLNNSAALTVRNLRFEGSSNPAQLSNSAYSGQGTSGRFDACEFVGFGGSVNTSFYWAAFSFRDCLFDRINLSNTPNSGVIGGAGPLVERCTFTRWNGVAIQTLLGGTIRQCFFIAPLDVNAIGVKTSSNSVHLVRIERCIFDNLHIGVFDLSNMTWVVLHISDNIFSKSDSGILKYAGAGQATPSSAIRAEYNAFYQVGTPYSGSTNPMVSPVFPTANPFLTSSNANPFLRVYKLNNLANGGNVCKRVTYAGIIPGFTGLSVEPRNLGVY